MENVTCPYCGHCIEEANPQPGAGYEQAHCPGCQKKFRVSASVEYMSKKSCQLNGLECEWETRVPSSVEHLKYEWYFCKICSTASIAKKAVKDVISE